MNRSAPYASFVAVAAVSVWVAVLLKILTGGNQWWWMLHTLIPGSMLTIVMTALLGRFWVARKKLPSFGTFIGVPFCSVYLVWFVQYFRGAGWQMFTAHYWDDMKSTLGQLLYHQGLIGTICVFPAIAIVIFYHRRSKRHDPNVAS